MLENIRGKIIAGICRLLPTCVGRRFVRQQDGAAAVEFALVAVPFLALTFAILETALVFFAGQTLEAAVSNAGRLIMTGQAQSAGFSQNEFKNRVCGFLSGGLFDCANGIYVNVKTYADFSAVNTTPPVNNGQFDTTKMNYTPGGPGCIVAVQLYYQWPIYVSMLGNNLSNLNGGNRLLVATSVFRNEPFGPAGSC
jgi:Flp pilus assembly protein TadG